MIQRTSSRLHRRSLRPLSSLSLRFLHSLFGFKHFSLPFQGAFHLSLAVLMRYRSSLIFRFADRNPASSHGIAESCYSGFLSISSPCYNYGAITLYGLAFQKYSLSTGKLDDRTIHHISAAFSTADSV